MQVGELAEREPHHPDIHSGAALRRAGAGADRSARHRYPGFGAYIGPRIEEREGALRVARYSGAFATRRREGWA